MEAGSEHIAELLDQEVWAVVGASRDPERFGYKIFTALRRFGYRVYPVTPSAAEIDGERAYPDLASLPEVPDVVDTVVPPKVTARIVGEAAALGLKRLWLQPGSESAEAIADAEARGLRVVHHACAMALGQAGPASRRKTTGG